MILALTRRFNPDSLKHFEIKRDVPELPGLTAELLADLHDFARKFGIKDMTDKLCRVSVSEPKEISVSVSMKPGNHQIILIGPGGVTDHGAYVVSLGEKEIVIWDRRISVVDVEVLIQQIDAEMQKKGFINSATGERITIAIQEKEKAPFCVEKVFSEKGAVMPVLPGCPSAEKLRAQFDEPDKVAIVDQPLSGKVLCHVRDIQYLEVRRQLAMKMLAERGITSLEQMDRLTMQDILAIREELERTFIEHK